MSKKIAVIGGGASGLVAAISAARQGAAVTVYEKNSRLGKKILSTGNGRCNISNKNAGISNYHGNNTAFMSDTVNSFWVKETEAFFEEIGLLLRAESDGKMYPYSNQASSVLDALRFEAERLGVEAVYDFEASKIIRVKDGYSFKSYDGREAFAECVIIAAGGKAAPGSGSNGSGYELCKMLGHSVTKLYPSLVQIKTKGGFAKSLKGIKINSALRIGEKSFFGELLFCDYGISGPPAFSASPYASKNKDSALYIDFMPEYSKKDVFLMLKKRKKRGMKLESYFVGMLNKRLGLALLKYCGITEFSREAQYLTDEEIKKLSDAVKGLELITDGTLSWNNAQVTAGGVEVYGIDSKSMQSKYNEGLYFCGEIIDIDGDCGGYNLQWAWSSGYIAGASAANKIKGSNK